MRHKKASLEWKFREFELRHTRGIWWYAGAGVVVGALLVYCAITANYLFAVLVMLVTLVVFSHQVYTPPFVVCEITNDGITLDDEFYPWKSIENFWIITVAAEQRYTLYCKVKRGLSPLLSIPLVNASRVEQVRAMLSEYVEEDKEYVREPRWEWLMRKLKI